MTIFYGRFSGVFSLFLLAVLIAAPESRAGGKDGPARPDLQYYGYYYNENFAIHSLDKVKSYTNTYFIQIPTDIKAVTRARNAGMKIIISLSDCFSVPGGDPTASTDGWERCLKKAAERYDDDGLRSVDVVYVFDEPDMHGVSTEEAEKMTALAKRYFPYSKTMIGYNLFRGTRATRKNPDGSAVTVIEGFQAAKNLDIVAVDPFFYPDYPLPSGSFERCPGIDHKRPENFKACYSWYVHPRLQWALDTGKPIILIGQSHGMLSNPPREMAGKPRDIMFPQPPVQTQDFYVQTVLENPRIIGLLWFLYNDMSYAHSRPPSGFLLHDLIGAVFDVRNLVFHRLAATILLNRPENEVFKDFHPFSDEAGVYPKEVLLAANKPFTYSCGVTRLVPYKHQGPLVVYPGAEFRSSDPAVAVVNAQGVATGLSPGKADIITAFEGKQFVTHVTVVDAATLTELHVFREEKAGACASNAPGGSCLEIPSNLVLDPKAIIRLTVRHTDQYGNSAFVAPEWETAEPRLASVSWDGQVSVASGSREFMPSCRKPDCRADCDDSECRTVLNVRYQIGTKKIVLHIRKK